MTIKDFERLDVNTGELGTGRLFVGPDGSQLNLDRVNVLWAGTDTIRQMFEGRPEEHQFHEIADAYEAGVGSTVTLGGYEFAVKSGKQGGFKYMLQNNQLGLTLLYKHFYAEADALSTHLKIECSPQWLYERDKYQINDELFEWAGKLLKNPKPNAVAVHLAVDFQGWEPPQDFDSHFVTKARRVQRYDGMAEFRFQGCDSAIVHGRGTSFTFGKANSLQFCLYNKSEEVDVSDKRDFMESIWRTATNDDTFPATCYDEEAPVWRLEVRFHQRIINELWRGTDAVGPIYTYLEADRHLTGLWQYALRSNRYEYRKDWVHPIWTFLRDEVSFGHKAPPIAYKRQKKTPGCGNEKNVALAFGNLLSIYARNRFNAQQAWHCLKKSGLWNDLKSYYRRREITERMLYEMVRDGLTQRRLQGKVAA